MIYALIGCLVLLYLSQEFIRKWFFNRTGFVNLNNAPIQSPVDGTVCYIRANSDFEATKRGTRFYYLPKINLKGNGAR